MNMPTVCSCGELVEFDDMKPIGNQLYCEDCYQEQSSEEQEDIQPLYEMQDILDKRIIKEKGLESYDLLEEKILALQVELAECANEWRGFKYWSEDQEPRTRHERKCNACKGKGKFVVEVTNFQTCGYCDGTGIEGQSNPLLEEYVDVLHFILSIGNMSKLNQIIIDNFEYEELPDEGKRQITMKYNSVFYYVTKTLFEQDYYPRLAIEFFQLGEMLGFTWEEIKQAYYDKNKVNHERQNNGY